MIQADLESLSHNYVLLSHLGNPWSILQLNYAPLASLTRQLACKVILCHLQYLTKYSVTLLSR